MKHDPKTCWECQEFLPHVRNPKPVNWDKPTPDYVCEECHGTGLTTISNYDGNGSDADDQPCPYCTALNGRDQS